MASLIQASTETTEALLLATKLAEEWKLPFTLVHHFLLHERELLRLCDRVELLEQQRGHHG